MIAKESPEDRAAVPASRCSTGMALMATGTDTGGSIRIPASFCGVTGLKPTYGRVSRYGVKPLGISLDHIGPLAQTVRDTAIALNAMAGFDDRDPSSSPAPVLEYIPPSPCSIAGLTIGIPRNYFFEAVYAGDPRRYRTGDALK